MTCFLSLRTQFENLGDEVINGMMLREICARSDVVALGNAVPGWYVDNINDVLGPLRGRMKIQSSSPLFLRSMICAGLFGKGSLLFTSCGDVSSRRSRYGRDGALEAIQYLPRLRLGQIGASMSSLSRSKARLMRVASARSTCLSVRDGRSRAVLAEQGLSLPVVPDLAFLLPVTSPRPDDQMRHLAIIQMREIAQTPFETVVSLTTSLAAQAAAVGLTACIASQVDFDAAFGERLAAATGLPVVTPAATQRGRFAAFTELYAQTALIFSNRLHGLLVGASKGAVPVPVLHDAERKVRGVFEDAGLAAEIMASAVSVGPFPLWNATRRLTTHARVEKVFREASVKLRCFFDEILGPPTVLIPDGAVGGRGEDSLDAD